MTPVAPRCYAGERASAEKRDEARGTVMAAGGATTPSILQACTRAVCNIHTRTHASNGREIIFLTLCALHSDDTACSS